MILGREIWSRLTVHNSAGVGGLVIAREIRAEKMRCWVLQSESREKTKRGAKMI
jgi:hypothetical protein